MSPSSFASPGRRPSRPTTPRDSRGDPAGRRYETNGVAGPLLPPELALTMTTATGGPPRPLGAITFTPDGSSSGGRVVLVAGHNAVAVVVDWLTGRVSVADAA